jgi:hypothetical protein
MAFDQLTAAHRLGYQENVMLALQQKTSRLKMCATYAPNLKGKSARVVEIVAPMEGDYDLSRNAKAQMTDLAIEQVWCKPRRLNTKMHLLEWEDAVKASTDYANSYSQADAATLSRMEDRVMADALWAGRIVGEDGLQLQAYNNVNGFVAQNYVPSGAATPSGLTVAKIVKGLELLEQAEVDVENEPVYLQATAKQVTDLYNQLIFTNKDYRDKSVIDEARKQVHELLGVKIIRMRDEFVNKVTTNRRCMLFAQSGLHYGEFLQVKTMAAPSIEHYDRIMMGSEEWVGCTRSEDEKFVSIDCLEA